MTTQIQSSISNDKSSGIAVPVNGGGLFNSTTTVDSSTVQTDLGYSPYMRNIDIDLASVRLRPRRQVYVYFDDVNMSSFWENPNKITISGKTKTFGDILSGDQELLSLAGANARILLVESDFILNQTRIYTSAWDGLKSAITTANTVRGIETGNTGTVIAYEHRSGYVRSGSNNSHIIMGLDANSTINNYYVGNSISIVTGANAGRVSANIISYNASTRTARVSPAFPYRQANAIYSLGDPRKLRSANAYQSMYTTDFGYFAGVLHVPNPANNTVKFLTGEHVITISDSPQGPDSDDFATKATYKFSSSRLDIGQTQLIPGIRGNVFSSQTFSGGKPTEAWVFPPIGRPPQGIDLPTRYQPLAQTFRVYGDRYPNGFFIHSVDLWFKTKDEVSALPVVVEIHTTQNEVPTSTVVPGAVAQVQCEDIVTSDLPRFNRSSGLVLAEKSNTATRFVFPSPIYLAPATTYAICVRLPTNYFDLWVGEAGQKLIGSNHIIQKLNFTGGGLFKSQNSLLYELIPNEDLMLQVNACEFPTDVTGEVILSEEKTLGAVGSGTATNIPEGRGNSYADHVTVLSDALKLPGTTIRNFYKSYTDANSTLETLYTPYVPEKTIHFRERKKIVDMELLPRSFYTKYELATTDPLVSPVIYYKRQEAVFHENIINNMPLSNNLINIVDGGASYNGANTSVVFTSPTGSGANAYVTSNSTTGEIESVIVDAGGSGYFDNVEISLVSASGSGAVLNVSHELNAFGGPGLMRYISKPVTLADGFDGGDLRVYLTAIKPASSNIQAYYKVRNSLDPATLDEIGWKKFEQYTSPYTYSSGLSPIELEFRPSNVENALSYDSGDTTYTTFNQYQIKLVGASSGTTIYHVPQFLDMRAIALPGDPNQTV